MMRPSRLISVSFSKTMCRALSYGMICKRKAFSSGGGVDRKIALAELAEKSNLGGRRG